MDINKLKFLENNPRSITAENFDKLKRDIKDDTDFLKKRKILVNRRGDDLIVYAGNMRIRALKSLGYTEIPDEFLDIEDNIGEEIMRKRVLRDNQEYGEWDKEALANSWDDELKTLDLPELNVEKILGDDLENIKPEVEFSKELLESNNYVVLVFNNEIDWNSATDILNLEIVKTAESKEGYELKGLGKVIEGRTIIDKLIEKKYENNNA